MFGQENYIKQNFPQGVIYSPIIYTPSINVSVGAIGVQKDYTQMGALWIVCHVLILSMSVNAIGNLYTFTDNFNSVLAVFEGDPGNSGIQVFPYIIQGGVLNLQIAGAGIGQVKFSIGHQYLMVDDKK